MIPANFQSRLFQIAIFFAVMWAVFLLDPAGQFTVYALRPKMQPIIPGIIALPFLHGNMQHIISNTTALAVLMPMMAMFEKDFWIRIALMIAASGALLWQFGPVGESHIGASSLLFAVLGYLMALAVIRGKIVGTIIVAALVWWQWNELAVNMFPENPGVSGIGHQVGLIAGILLAVLWRPRG